MLLVQAGRTAIGVWDDDELLAHKVITKYVVRGKGRAQPTHLETKGKSRYGSRLRLQNARRQLVEANEKLAEYWEERGPPRLVHYAAPVRTWPELFGVDPVPPFDQRDAMLCKIAFHAHAPSFEELQRVRRRLGRGSHRLAAGPLSTALSSTPAAEASFERAARGAARIRRPS